ncbi:hypothetical protein HDU96_000885 [Phlyctochytrium bullatum]|nr:hypothetical protein HDU96_000885 [Phlyctochytrium bullatum]
MNKLFSRSSNTGGGNGNGNGNGSPFFGGSSDSSRPNSGSGSGLFASLLKGSSKQQDSSSSESGSVWSTIGRFQGSSSSPVPPSPKPNVFTSDYDRQDVGSGPSSASAGGYPTNLTYTNPNPRTASLSRSVGRSPSVQSTSQDWQYQQSSTLTRTPDVPPVPSIPSQYQNAARSPLPPGSPGAFKPLGLPLPSTSPSLDFMPSSFSTSPRHTTEAKPVTSPGLVNANPYGTTIPPSPKGPASPKVTSPNRTGLILTDFALPPTAPTPDPIPAEEKELEDKFGTFNAPPRSLSRRKKPNPGEVKEEDLEFFNAPPRSLSRRKKPSTDEPNDEGLEYFNAPPRSLSRPKKAHAAAAAEPGAFVPPKRTLSTRGRKLDKAPDAPSPLQTPEGSPSISGGAFTPPMRTLSRKGRSASTPRSPTGPSGEGFVPPTRTLSRKVKKPQNQQSKDEGEVVHDILFSYGAETPSNADGTSAENRPRMPDDYPIPSPSVDGYPQFGSSRRKTKSSLADEGNFSSLPRMPSAKKEAFASPPRTESLSRSRSKREPGQGDIPPVPKAVALERAGRSESASGSLNRSKSRDPRLETAQQAGAPSSPVPPARSPRVAQVAGEGSSSPSMSRSKTYDASPSYGVGSSTSLQRNAYAGGSTQAAPKSTFSAEIEDSFARIIGPWDNPSSPSFGSPSSDPPSASVSGTFRVPGPAPVSSPPQTYTDYPVPPPRTRYRSADQKSLASVRTGASAYSNRSLNEAWSKLKEASVNPGISDGAPGQSTGSFLKDMMLNPGKKE